MTTPFHDLEAYIALPRVTGLAVSPDGSRLATTVATLDPGRTRYVNAIWEVDPMGDRPARRLTWSAKGETGAAFLPNGDLLFTSARPDHGGMSDSTADITDNSVVDHDDDDDVSKLWLLPAAGGEARGVARPPAGIDGLVVASDSGTILLASKTFPSSTDAESDAAKRAQRTQQRVSAILHERLPVRRWDHDLGPDAPRLFVGTLGDDGSLALLDLTPDAGMALVEAHYDISDDGSTVVTEWHVPEVGGRRSTLVAIDVATHGHRVLVDDSAYEFEWPAISPDGSQVAAIRERITSPTDPPDRTLVVVSMADGTVREVADGWDRWPTAPRWMPDGSSLLVAADDRGRSPVFRIDVTPGASGAVTALTADDAAFTDVVVPSDGRSAYALQTSYATPPAPVRLDPAKPDQKVTTLPAPAPTPDLPGHLTEVAATADDGTSLRAWLALPDSASAATPAPLLLWVHGGPLASWNAWSWRWNPWLMVARGYAVLLPDPALSTGYGLDFIRRGWGDWGGAPYTDLMAITDAAAARDDIDGGRTAAMGGSFGGYMANWIAGNTDRFDAIVSHASLWALDQFASTTDAPWYWDREMSPEMMVANSPHRRADDIVTPMLVIHGDYDYRVPIGEALRLWRDLASRATAADGEMAHRFLYFPDEHHWVLAPQHVKVWYETVVAFLAHHVLGEKWQTPSTLE